MIMDDDERGAVDGMLGGGGNRRFVATNPICFDLGSNTGH
jgi:hypothetical protein